MKKEDLKNQNKSEVEKYIREYSDLSDEEVAELTEKLDMDTIKAFEEALERTEEELNREKSKAEVLLDYISDRNIENKSVSRTNLLSNPPEGINDSEIQEMLEYLGEYEELENIDIIESKKDLYYFNIFLWTRQYAKTKVLIDEEDILEAVANRTRTDSKIYPRPVQVSALNKPPYNLNKADVIELLEIMGKTEDYKDIKSVEASNGGMCIYSTKHMSEKYARALCEELEVKWMDHQ